MFLVFLIFGYHLSPPSHPLRILIHNIPIQVLVVALEIAVFWDLQILEPVFLLDCLIFLAVARVGVGALEYLNLNY